MIRFKWQYLFMLAVALSCVSAPVEADVEAAPFVSRKIIALYDSTEPGNASAVTTRIHDYAEMPLNQIGFVVDYWDVSKGLPPEDQTRDAQGFISWFEDDLMKGAAGYLNWAADQMDLGKRFVILGGFGALGEPADPGGLTAMRPIPKGDVRRFFKALGVDHDGGYTDNSLGLKWGRCDRGMTEFEIARPPRPPYYDGVRVSGPKNGERAGRSFLEIIRSDGGGRMDAVAVTARGGYALREYEIERFGSSARWRIDPFGFFEAALGSADTPKPDPTTLTGRRVFYTHIDGDGVRNESRFEKGVWASEAVYRDLIQPFDFPVTVSFITAEIDPEFGGSARAFELARRMYADPKVHPAAHTFTHPFDWERKITALAVPGYSRSLNSEKDREVLYGSSYLKGAVVTASDAEYAERETAGSCRFISEKADPRHRSAMMFWSGNCVTSESVLAPLESEGLLNMNGGDSRFDRMYPTYTAVAPFSAPVGAYRQIYSSNANENIYTDLWRSSFGGYAHVIQTHLNTERPRGLGSRKPARRVSAAGVYYHFYTGERKSALEATATALRFARDRDWAAVTAADYARMVKGFLAAKVSADGDGWRVKDYGECRTLRIDGTGRYPDLGLSRGVMGFNEWAGHLYIHLDAADEARLVLTSVPPAGVYLRSSSAAVRDFEAADGRISFEISSEREAEALIAGAAAAAVYRGGWKDSAGNVGELKVTASDDGSMSVRLPAARAAVVSLVRKV